MVFHNLQGYDSHLFIKQLAKVSGDLSCIPSTEEKYISFSKKIKLGEYNSRNKGRALSIKVEIRFIDSFRFLPTSLANLVSNLQPTHGFKWVDYDKNEVINLLEKRDTNKGYIFEVDLEYPKSYGNRIMIILLHQKK